MSYSCYLGGMEVPTPAKLTVKVKGKNKTLILLNEGEINFLRSPGLTEITVPLLLPMLGGSRSPSAYLDMLEGLKTGKGTTQFILVRSSPDGRRLFDTNLTVSVEDYNIVEDAKKGLDVSVDVNLKQWRPYGTKTATVEPPAEPSQPPTVTVEQEREASTAPAAKTYTVKKGDSLWAIAAKYYGKGSDYSKIAGANTDKISNPTPEPVDIALNLTYAPGWSWEAVKSYVEGVIDNYFVELAKTWASSDFLVVRISQIESRILAGCATMITDIGGTKINGVESNLALDADSVPVRGGISG